MWIDILFLVTVGAVWSWINQRVREDSGGEYSGWLDAIMDGLKKAEESLASEETWVQLVFGPIIGILEAVASFVDSTIVDLTGATGSVGEYLSDRFSEMMEDVLDKVEENKEKIKDIDERIHDLIEEKLPDLDEKIDDVKDEMHDIVENKLNQTIENQAKVVNNLKESIDEQIEQTKEITTNIDYILRDQTYESVDDLKNAYDHVMQEAYEKLYESRTIADTYLNRDIFNTVLQMNMWADLFEAATTIDEEKARENLRKQLAVYKDLYLEAIKQYKEIAESIQAAKRQGA